MKTLQNVSVPMIIIAGALLLPRFASAGADIVVDALPPVSRIEHEPPHRDGFVWAPGYWQWTGHFFHWVSGTWVVERRRSHWVADHWDQIGSQWHYVAGHWEPLAATYNARTP